MAQPTIRPSRFAGSFYPGTEKEIKRMLDIFIERTGPVERAPHPPVLILPHAGWQFSGLAAVRGLTSLKSSPPSRAVLIGPSHRHHFLGFSPAGYEKYKTPLGELQVDLVLQNEICDQTGFQFENEAHISEHSVEVILPMLQYVLPEVQNILPILAGTISRATVNKLADALASLLNPLEDILIISTDLSHFYSYDEARSLDQETLNFILEGNSDGVMGRSGEGGRLACGYAGVAVAIGLADRWHLGKPEILIYYNSGDSGGDRDSVVGYAALAYPPPDLGASPN